MPRRDDIRKILVIGSGPIIIGQASEFDYSGTQACKVLKDQGYEVVLVNSNPATIMTDPGMATRTYVEPITPEVVTRVIQEERPDALLPNLGGQTALNTAVALAESGVLEEYGVEVIGCRIESIQRGEDRKLFAEAMQNIGLEIVRGDYAYSVADAERIAGELGFPVVLRPSFTLGGAGGGIAYNVEELRQIVSQGLDLSPAGEVLIEESIIGWKELEMEVIRDRTGAAVVVCSIENFDPMGVHTGDSITVAPAQTLSEEITQRLRDASIAVLEEIGVDSGGSNVQFAIHPETGRMIVIEMNPRVSRSSALASKATGYPIAKITALLAIGFDLSEIENDLVPGLTIDRDPVIDYCVVKVPRFAFEKFAGTDETLTTRMKAVGEVMGIGRSFEEALNKAMRSLENGRTGLVSQEAAKADDRELNRRLSVPTADRIYYIAEALRRGMTVAEINELTDIDRLFLTYLERIVDLERRIAEVELQGLGEKLMREAKRLGISDGTIAELTGATEPEVREARKALGVTPVFKKVDTCAGMQESASEYAYKTYDEISEFAPAEKPRALILGAGPNRIGQGIEFDYCCVHAAYALTDLGYETVMINCNPETVSTDYDTSDRLYFEPLTFEDVMDIVDVEDPAGVVVTLGGQTPLKLASALTELGVPIMGTPYDAIDLAEDRDRFSKLLDELGIVYPASGIAETPDDAVEVARRIGFPLLVRPSYVLGGRGMAIVYDEAYLRKYMTTAAKVTPDHPVYLDTFLEGALEVDVDALCDGTDVYIGGILEHIEEAGIHSGDSACCTPPFSLSESVLATIREHTRDLALAIGVRGLMNIQFAVKDSTVYVIEVNPRASRTVPFSAKATGVPLARAAAFIMAGRDIADLGLPDDDREFDHFSVKEAVMPFGRFPGSDVVLGPEMRSTGEVMGVARDFPTAYAKTQLAVDYSLPSGGTAFVSVNDNDKRAVVPLVRELVELGFEIVSTRGTARSLKANGIPVRRVNKMGEARPNIGDEIANGAIDFMINTPFGQETRSDGYHLRSAAVRHGVTYVTTIEAAQAMVQAIASFKEHDLEVIALQDLGNTEVQA